jgi:hypothetical protein
MKKTVALLLMLSLVACFVGPASAAKKKAKGPKPFKSEEVSIQLGHSVLYGNSGTIVGITAQEFMNNCGIPTTNGFDAYVWEIPAEYKNVDAMVTGIGSGGSAGYDIDFFLFDDACKVTLASQSTSADEVNVMAKGTASYILIYNFGAPDSPAGGSDPITAHFELKPHTL